MIGFNHQVSDFPHFQSCDTLLGFNFGDTPALTHPSVLCGRYLVIFKAVLAIYETKMRMLQN